ncbi:Uncharacterised protein [Vibrio cholerae]|nr:Uncharacterised protein [Vibrio cholerae]
MLNRLSLVKLHAWWMRRGVTSNFVKALSLQNSVYLV